MAKQIAHISLNSVETYMSKEAVSQPFERFDTNPATLIGSPRQFNFTRK